MHVNPTARTVQAQADVTWGELIYIRTLGGVIARVGTDHSAFAHRLAAYNLT